MKLDTGGEILARCYRELESGPVGDAGWQRDMHRLMPQLGTGALALRAGLGPRLAASSAVPAGAMHRHIEWHRCAVARLAIGEANGGAQLRWTLVGEKRTADARERDVNRRKVDRHFVGKAARVVAVFARDDCNRIAPVWTECPPPHDREGTIGIAPGEVNGDQGVPALWRDDAAA